jgi:hypothetical protein
MDPFLGNGTAAIVAKGNFRHYLGFELNREMAPVIEGNLNSIGAGELYFPFSERKDEEGIVRRARERFGSK